MKNGNEIPAPVRAHSKGDFKTYRTFSRGSNRTCTFFAIDKIYLSIIQKKNIVISLYLGKWYPYATVTNTATKLVVWRNTHLLYCNMGSLMEVQRPCSLLKVSFLSFPAPRSHTLLTSCSRFLHITDSSELFFWFLLPSSLLLRALTPLPPKVISPSHDSWHHHTCKVSLILCTKIYTNLQN